MTTHQPEQSPAAILHREDHMIAGFAALAIAIHILEAAFPSPLPGVKPGLANVVTVVVYLRYGLRTAAWVALLRVLVGSLLIGTFLSPTFLLSATGAILSLLTLGLVGSMGRRMIGALGLSVAAALAHMSGQIWVAYTLFIPHPAILNLTPLLLTAALVFGTVSGIIAASLILLLEKRDV
jgi:heptaprenyl diphosphate synthase